MKSARSFIVLFNVVRDTEFRSISELFPEWHLRSFRER